MKNIILIFALIYSSSCILSCGVKGDPVPPGTPVELGRGQPTFKKAVKKIPWPKKYTGEEGDDWKDDKETEWQE